MTTSSIRLAGALALCVAGCGSPADSPADLTSPPTDDGGALLDGAAPDLVQVAPPSYDYQPPPVGAIPDGLDPATWLTHHKDDLLPYWTMASAKGTPVGNFPTFRGMDGSVQPPGQRKPRMIGRQVYTYAVGFLLTGDESLLDLARAGNRWLLDHAQDKVRGGWYADLDNVGAPYQDNDKTAQDFAYTVMGPAAWYFVTRDSESEAAVLATRDLLFDPKRYFDAGNGRIRDGMNGALDKETFIAGMGSWELVAQLDPVTAFMLLVQPVLTEPSRQMQFEGDLRTLALRIRDSFWKDGIFWGSTGAIGRYGSNHTDFGHILKAYWALLQIDKRLADHPLRDFLWQRAPATLAMAYDKPLGRWGKAPTSATEVAWGSDWWAYAEADQLAATLALHDGDWIPKLAATAGHFRSDYVDRTRPAREVVPSISRGGVWVYQWGDGDTAKCNEWKSGFHSAEHALVMYLFAHWLDNTPAPLYFALPADKATQLANASRPYSMLGHVAKVEDLRPLAADASRHVVRVSFDQLH